MPDKNTRREFLRTVGRTAGLLGLGGLVLSAATRSTPSVADAGAPRLPCEQCPALAGCTVADSLQARDALGARPQRASAADLPRLCSTTGKRADE